MNHSTGGEETPRRGDKNEAIAAYQVSFAIDGKEILQSIDFVGRGGEFIGLLGPNGAGKSTLLRILAGLRRPTEGEVALGGRAILQMTAPEVARQVAYVPQDTHISFGFTVKEIVLMGRHAHLGRFQVEGEADHRIAAEAMERVGVAPLAERNIVSLSGGERQMVFVAKALAQQPHVLLLDEPVSALDIRHQLHVLSLVRAETQRGVTAVAVLHDLNLAARFCDRVYMMAGGRVVAHGSPSEVYTEEVLARTYGVRVVVRHDEVVDSPTVTALDDA